MSFKYFLIRIYYLDKNTEVITCNDEKELRSVIMEDFDNFDLAKEDGIEEEHALYKNNLTGYYEYLETFSINHLKNQYLRLIGLHTEDGDYLKEVRIIKGTEIDNTVKI
jgi:hypothetical protein